MSHLQENDVVASMVVFEDGLARKSEYRRFVIKGHAGQPGAGRRRVDPRGDQPAVPPLRRGAGRDRRGRGRDQPGRRHRRTRGARRHRPETGRPRRFAYPPNLVVVDGGAPQVAAAQRALDELGVDDVALCGLAKRLEEVWLPGDPHPVVLPRTSEGLYLLQRVRDEAHRFAITHHRSRRSRSMTASALDGVAGLGETRRKALLKHFGSLKRLSAATVEEIVRGAGHRPAHRRGGGRRARRPASPALAVNTATGEILDDDPPHSADQSVDEETP